MPTSGSLSDNANDGLTDLALEKKNTAVCANTGDLCGGAKGARPRSSGCAPPACLTIALMRVSGLYQGPTVCCSGGGVTCVWLNHYASLCLTQAQKDAATASFGANTAAEATVVSGHEAAFSKST